jgi:hypothetical protein
VRKFLLPLLKFIFLEWKEMKKQIRTIAAAASFVVIAGLATTLVAQSADATMDSAEAQARETWRLTMHQTGVPGPGCFHASYPSTQWEVVECGRPSPHFNPRKGRNSITNQLGDGKDYAAQASGSNLISSAEGLFLQTAGGSSVSGVRGDVAGTKNSVANVFMLQMNTQAPFNATASSFATPACNGAPNGAAGCYGWQQFLFSQTQGPAPKSGQTSLPGAPGTTPGVFIEYWLYNWGSPCPVLPSWAGTGRWNDGGGGSCWFNGPMTYVPPQTAAELPGLVMTSSASAGQDVVSLSTTSGIYTYAEPSVLSLQKVWNQVEFNVFGDCCSTEANFTGPTALVLKTSIDDGSTSAPICESNDGTTAETNNLMLGSCAAAGGSAPYIEFTESVPSPTASLVVKGPSGQTVASPYLFGDMYTFTITGAANLPVTVDTVVNGVNQGMSASQGNTNASGVFQSSAEFTPAWGYVAGTYTETWYVGGTPASPILFTLVE